MFSLRIYRLALSLSALLCTSVSAQKIPLFTSLLPTGLRRDPVGEAVDLGSLPINLVLTPEKDRAVVVLSGWREQGVQVVDLKTRKVTQTLCSQAAGTKPTGAGRVAEGAARSKSPSCRSRRPAEDLAGRGCGRRCSRRTARQQPECRKGNA